LCLNFDRFHIKLILFVVQFLSNGAFVRLIVIQIPGFSFILAKLLTTKLNIDEKFVFLFIVMPVFFEFYSLFIAG